MKNTTVILTAVAFYCMTNSSSAHSSHSEPDVKLHTSSKWGSCSFQLDPSLTQKDWHQFTKEVGLIAYYRPMANAKPMGVGRYELSVIQIGTGIDETDDAWNNTFVHPDSEHWLIGGPTLKTPGFTFRTGITSKIDAGVFWTKAPKANWGLYGGHVQYNLINNEEKGWNASARGSFVSLYGPKDLNMTVYGLDVLGSKEFRVYSDWLAISPYAGISTYLSHAHEKTDVVNLKNENVFGVRGTLGAVAQISIVRFGVEYNLAAVNSLSFQLGANFTIKSKTK